MYLPDKMRCDTDPSNHISIESSPSNHRTDNRVEQLTSVSPVCMTDFGRPLINARSETEILQG